MESIKNAQVVLIIAFLVCTVLGADNNKPSENVNANEIFNSMIQTMPKEMKSRVDSASVSQMSQKNGIKSTGEKSPAKVSKKEAARMQGVDLNKLPESVREQVRKTMQELEQQKEERILEFKENNNKQK
ncbi:MAG: hypothetical protein JW915_06940 [Chitinispirillaceae bacterium]|nr:hypothetical protein [Chitinispirillaceae bacterium]